MLDSISTVLDYVRGNAFSYIGFLFLSLFFSAAYKSEVRQDTESLDEMNFNIRIPKFSRYPITVLAAFSSLLFIYLLLSSQGSYIERLSDNRPFGILTSIIVLLVLHKNMWKIIVSSEITFFSLLRWRRSLAFSEITLAKIYVRLDTPISIEVFSDENKLFHVNSKMLGFFTFIKRLEKERVPHVYLKPKIFSFMKDRPIKPYNSEQ